MEYLTAVIGIVMLFLIYRGALKSEINNLQEAVKETKKELDALDKKSRQKLAELTIKSKEEITALKKDVAENLRKNIPFGEQILLSSFIKMLSKEDFKDYTVYHQLEFNDGRRFFKADFLLVTPAGLVILESKRWKGTTHIYTEQMMATDIFCNTVHKDFGLNTHSHFRIFNTQQAADSDNELVLSSYKNPLDQVREYSVKLNKLLNLPVRNAVVFSYADDYKVLFNNQPFAEQAIDGFTSIVTDNAIKDYCRKQWRKTPIDSNAIRNRIDQHCNYSFKMDRGNYQKAPFSLLL